MKKKLIIMILGISLATLISCGNNDEQVQQVISSNAISTSDVRDTLEKAKDTQATVNTGSVTETEPTETTEPTEPVESEPEPTEPVESEPSEIIEDEEEYTDPYADFSVSYITLSEEGEISIDDVFLNAVQELPQYQNFSREEIVLFLECKIGDTIPLRETTRTKTVYNILNAYSESVILSNLDLIAENNLLENITPLDKIMYSKGDVNVRKGPSQDFEKVGTLTLNQEVHIVGKSEETGWYQIEFNGDLAYVSNKYVAQEMIVTSQTGETSTSQGNNSTSPAPSQGLDDHLFGQDDPNDGYSTGERMEHGWRTY